MISIPDGSSVTDSSLLMRGENAYVGPRAFDHREWRRLYGRDPAVRALMSLLSVEQVVLLYSPSGAGKTSLLQNRIIPELESVGIVALPIDRVGVKVPAAGAVTPPAVNPLLSNTILSLDAKRPEWATDLRGSARTTGLKAYLEELRDLNGNHRAAQVMVFDQFEEALNGLVTESEKREFFMELGRALINPRLSVIFAFREEWLSELERYVPLLTSTSPAKYRLELLRREEARQAIENPARMGLVSYDSDAVELLLDKLAETRIRRDGITIPAKGETIEPVHLQLVCHRLWEQLISPRRLIGEPNEISITRANVQDAGEIQAVLQHFYAEGVTAAAAESGVSEDFLRDWIEENLIAPGGLRDQVLYGDAETRGLPNEALAHLENGRVVRKEIRRNITWVELTHDLLVQPVRDENRDWREKQSQLWRSARAWDKAKRPAKMLLPLREAFLAKSESLTMLEKAFIAQSFWAGMRKLLGWLGILLIVGLLAFLAAVWYLGRQAEERRYWDNSTEIFDLKTEVLVRSTMIVPRESTPIGSMADKPSSDRNPVLVPRERSREDLERDRVGALALLRTVDVSGQRVGGTVRWQAIPGEVPERLRQRGFNVQLSPGGEGRANAITFGDSVPLQAVKLVALEMTARGTPPVRLRLSRDSTRIRDIEVSHVLSLSEWPPLPTEAIVRIRTAHRDDAPGVIGEQQ